MADDPFSIPLPPSPLTAASPNINHTNKVFTPEKTTENGQEMINFMHDEDYFDPDNNSGPSNACSDSFSYNINIVGISILAVDSVVLDPYYQFDILSTANNNILLMI